MYSMKIDGHMPNPSPTLHVAGCTIVLKAKLALVITWKRKWTTSIQRASIHKILNINSIHTLNEKQKYESCCEYLIVPRAIIHTKFEFATTHYQFGYEILCYGRWISSKISWPLEMVIVPLVHYYTSCAYCTQYALILLPLNHYCFAARSAIIFMFSYETADKKVRSCHKKSYNDCWYRTCRIQGWWCLVSSSEWSLDQSLLSAFTLICDAY